MSVEDNVEQQRALYGEPLGALVRRAAVPLGLSQAATARLLGLSPAMLSHLVTGQRVKIANPAALARLQALLDLADQAPRLGAAEVTARLDDIAALSADLTTSSQRARPEADPQAIRNLLRAVASGRELEQAVAALTPVAPGLAEALRVYGTGSDEEVRAHHASIRHLL